MQYFGFYICFGFRASYFEYFRIFGPIVPICHILVQPKSLSRETLQTGDKTCLKWPLDMAEQENYHGGS